MKVYPSELKHKFRKVLPHLFDTINHLQNTVKIRRNYLGSFIIANINPFSTDVSFIYNPLKTLKNLQFWGVAGMLVK